MNTESDSYCLQNTIRYVSVGGPTGWAGIAKTIRDVDEDKIKDYKEDIDTLLVFVCTPALLTTITQRLIFIVRPVCSPQY